jgi:F0F1-type ATP synthase alpha subunit
MESNRPQIGQDIEDKKEIKPETEEALKAAITEFKQSMPY